MHVCTISARRTGKSSQVDLNGPLTPAGYLTLRRTAAGYTTDALARALLILQEHGRFERPTLEEGRARYRRMRDIVVLLERRGSVTFDHHLLTAIASLFPFSPAIYALLAGDQAGTAQICRSCGCSDHDACITDAGVCTWATRALCSHCLDAAIIEQEAAR